MIRLCLCPAAENRIVYGHKLQLGQFLKFAGRDEVFVIVGATVNGRKAEARWSFNVAPKEAVQAGT